MKQRIITGILAGAVFVALLVAGGIGFNALILLLALIGYYEFIRMNDYRIQDPAALIGFACTIYLTVPWSSYTDMTLPSDKSIIWLTMLLMLCMTVISKNKTTIDKISFLFIGTVYLGFGFQAIAATRLHENGLYWAFLLVACIVATDTGAYFTGRFVGRRLLWPSISPKKTVEGAIGGTVISIVVALIFSICSPDRLEIGQAVCLGFLVAVVGQMGDFIQSAYKRVRNIKDTGALLPGHGGVLDRFDSWLVVFPFVQLFSLLY